MLCGFAALLAGELVSFADFCQNLLYGIRIRYHHALPLSTQTVRES
jgi:hypothetical protein